MGRFTCRLRQSHKPILKNMNSKPTHPTRIILSGLAGAGKSSVGKTLAEKLDYTYRMASTPAREEADKRGISIQELQVQLENDFDFDRKLDGELVAWGEEHDCWVMDYRLGCALIPEATSIYLTVEHTEAARRIKAASRPGEFNGNESTEEILTSINGRNEAMRKRLQKVHGVDFTDQIKYDYVISTDGKSINEVVDDIMFRVNG
jgi:cytidylate kinase